MVRRARTVVGFFLIVILTLGIIFVLGLRAKNPLVVNTQRRVNRAVFNPRQMRTAGTPGAFASIVRHTGRRSGRDYATPVGAVPTGDGFVIALVYGSETDWLKNVLASGSATVVHEGQEYLVDRPEVLPIEAAASFLSAGDQRAHRAVGVRQCLRVRLAEPAGASVGDADEPGET